ncbi:MAG: 1-acyl-sn-glycerol-3-phosphate acyltransferase [Phycisphaerales bacterium]|nr:1-acyl-sn-glycerol-3-phosphate acyltransferase [Planctomycetota bacterium]MCH8509909.1 1-acyl-sn-glycerol-3-phosphate acyltransferase [Phycisphaerales bacterium]
MLFWVSGILLAVVLLLLAAGVMSARRLRDPADPLTGLLYIAGRTYARLVHRLRVETEPGALSDIDGPLIVVSNHTAGVDPLLVSAGCPRRIGWIMAEDMRIPHLNWFWRWQGVIFVTRDKEGRKGLRDARTALANGACIGIFPEGRLERPHGRLLPFNPGVGMLVKRTKARILPVIVEGTPETETAWQALWTPSRAKVRFMRPISYADSSLTAAEIAADLQHRYAAWTGWPVANHAPAARIKSKAAPPASIKTDRSIA